VLPLPRLGCASICPSIFLTACITAHCWRGRLPRAMKGGETP
jgi:hypothetical protein